MNENAEQFRKDGTLRFLPSPPDAATRRVVVEKLGHFATSDKWIAEGLSPDLDALRSRHLQVRDQVAAEGQVYLDGCAKWSAEDAAYEEQLRDAHREGRPVAEVEDRRTPVAKREAEQARSLERYWQGVHVLGEKADEIRAYFREHEPELLAELRRRSLPAQEKLQEARRLLAEAESERWNIFQTGMWVQKTTDGGAPAQPAPVASLPPKQFNSEMLERALERPWHEREEPVVGWLDQQKPAADDGDGDLVGDPTGEFSEELIETGAA